MIVVSGAEVAARLDYPRCIALMREAMTALSQGRTRQLLRGILDLKNGDMFGVMPGALDEGPFGAKLISVLPGNFALGRPSHQGVIVLFDPADGRPVCLLDATEVTAIRTAAASAAATEVLARPHARRLAILGYGEQAWRHACALPNVRPIAELRVWGRSAERAAAFAARVEAELALPCRPAARVADAVRDADVICTTTAAAEPILFSGEVADGAHINAVGSSRAGPSEVDALLVARARFFADHRAGVLAQGAEFLNAKAAGLIGDDHVVGEIGQVMDGSLPGRTRADEVTIYKSLGSIVQDLACGWDLYRRAKAEGFGTEAAT
jgi:ornithine cyclodeaminase